ncbi:MAG: prepilin-type N-terminal cleavage/methylation domain-containing protein [Planctomycetes bacterium]|nr:prepilin-type N-terminal cleavage/methylation domain-containing protein [Planctomycetota bacterium]
MMGTRTSGAGRAYRRMPRAFSLAEMMIALVILGFGLLIIGAALPVGLTYTRDSIDMATGEAAAEYGMDEVDRCIRLSRTAYRDNVFRPRQNATGTLVSWEPVIKVRPLVAANVVRPVAGGAWTVRADPAEEMIRQWLATFTATPPQEEVDFPIGFDIPPGDGVFDSLFHHPTLSAVARVYPPVTPDDVFSTSGFFASQYDPNAARISTPEMEEAVDRRVSWTAFYRRADASSHKGSGDSTLYEVLVVAVRRPTTQHLFELPSAIALATGFDPDETALAGGSDVLAKRAYAAGPAAVAPVPWLVTFKELPVPPFFRTDVLERTLTGPDLPTVTFKCRASRERTTNMFEAFSDLLPVGALIIPAVNDVAPNLGAWGGQMAGFVPNAPDTLPIYEVIDRPDLTTVVVKSNGFYPWVNDGNPLRWPVWVIPPTFKERDTAGNPRFEDRSPILAVTRRYIRFPEIP